ncbi:MAG: 2-polyprenyl-3-methyl-6-methoxy-1,4-benzoquinone monooxygenase [Candidatus Methylopumilus sp.]|nr:2-polyprenyl-3-methyl-6-methoxy-1,4-benzoquinone monooxygenase [Candidatus Methylopumilus sp.]
MIDDLIIEFDKGLKVLFAKPKGLRPRPDLHIEDAELTLDEKKLAIELMRVNHTGEVCAQALYSGQLLFNPNGEGTESLKKSSLEEIDHLDWCNSRINELGGKTSLLNPIWYTGSFLIGSLASALGEKYNLAFLAETEHQVTKHLTSHLNKISKKDLKTNKILEVMADDEDRHAKKAKELGGIELPDGIKKSMSFTSKIMTTFSAKI